MMTSKVDTLIALATGTEETCDFCHPDRPENYYVILWERTCPSHALEKAPGVQGHIVGEPPEEVRRAIETRRKVG